MKIKINLNDTVSCTLTKDGAKVTKNLGAHPTVCQFWELLGVLGVPGMYNGAEPLFEGNVLVFDIPSQRMSMLVADVIACLDALRKSSTDPVACALAQRLALELSLDPSA